MATRFAAKRDARPSRSTKITLAYWPRASQQSGTRVHRVQPANFQPANFQPANFQPANFQPANFQPANFQPNNLGLLATL
ncbi:MAG: hypothetical protein F6K26_55985 [Moorea sp. SIO2I5]|nr:hypothetical protein [Moorena sp. SIO2I5]